MLPRHQSIFPQPMVQKAPDSAYPQHIPEPSDFPFTSLTPTPVTARRGQLLLQTQSMLHCGWKNFTAQDRKALVTAWVSADLRYGVGDVQGTSEDLGKARAAFERFAPERAHIVPTTEEYHHFDNGTAAGFGRFEETFVPRGYQRRHSEVGRL